MSQTTIYMERTRERHDHTHAHDPRDPHGSRRMRRQAAQLLPREWEDATRQAMTTGESLAAIIARMWES